MWLWICGGVAAVAVLVYLVYFAKFLFLDNLRISGADPAMTAQIQSEFKDYIRQHPYGLPQRNVLLFMPSRFGSFLANSTQQISKVTSVRRKLFHTVEITIVQRVQQYTMQVGPVYYAVNSDGTIGDQVQGVQGVLIVDTAAGDTVNSGMKMLDGSQVNFVAHIRDNFSRAVPVQAAHFEVLSVKATTFTVVAQNGTRFIFDDTSDAEVALGRAQLLWSTITPAQQAKLAYFDLRFDPKVYACYRGDPCAAIPIVAAQPAPVQLPAQ